MRHIALAASTEAALNQAAPPTRPENGRSRHPSPTKTSTAPSTVIANHSPSKLATTSHHAYTTAAVSRAAMKPIPLGRPVRHVRAISHAESAQEKAAPHRFSPERSYPVSKAARGPLPTSMSVFAFPGRARQVADAEDEPTIEFMAKKATKKPENEKDPIGDAVRVTPSVHKPSGSVDRGAAHHSPPGPSNRVVTAPVILPSQVAPDSPTVPPSPFLRKPLSPITPDLIQDVHTDLTVHTPSPPKPIGRSNSVKDRIAQLESSMREKESSKSPSPTPTISRVQSQTKNRSGSPLALTMISPTHAARVELPPSPLVEFSPMPLPEAVRGRMAEMEVEIGDSTVRASRRQTMDELEEIFTAQARSLSSSDAVSSTEIAAAGQEVDDVPSAVGSSSSLIDLQDDVLLETSSITPQIMTSPSKHFSAMSEHSAATDVSSFDALTGDNADMVIDLPLESPHPMTLLENDLIETVSPGVDVPGEEKVDERMEIQVDVVADPKVTHEMVHDGHGTATEKLPAAADGPRSRESAIPGLVALVPQPPDVDSRPIEKTSKTFLPPRKPPVPRAQATSLERKPFKPTSHAAPTASSKARAASQTVKGSRMDPPVGPASKPAASTTVNKALPGSEAERTVRRVVTGPAMVSRPPLTSSTGSTSSMRPPLPPMPPKPLGVKSALPPSASVRSVSGLSRITSKTDVGPNKREANEQPHNSRPATTIPSQPPPPVRTERMKRKPPVPTFVPTRGKGRELPPSKSFTASTISSASDKRLGNITAKVKTGVAKVRPEAIPLPSSPLEATKAIPEDTFLPRSPSTAPSRSTPAHGLNTTVMHAPSPLRAKVSSPLISVARVKEPLDSVLPALSPIEAWRRAVPASPAGTWPQAEIAMPRSPLAVRRGSQPPSPLSMVHPKVAPVSPAPLIRHAHLTPETPSSPASPSFAKAQNVPPSPSPVVARPLSRADAEQTEVLIDDFEPGPRARYLSNDLPSPFLHASEGSIRARSVSRLSHASSPSKMRQPPTSPSPLAVPALALVSSHSMLSIPNGAQTISHSSSARLIDIPSPFRSDVQLPQAVDKEFPSNSTRYTKASTQPGGPGSSEESADELAGVTFKSATVGRAAGKVLRPKVKNQMLTTYDLLEMSAPSRTSKASRASGDVPVHGERKDVAGDRSPEKGAEMLLAKIAGSPMKSKTVTPGRERRALSAMDANKVDEAEFDGQF